MREQCNQTVAVINKKEHDTAVSVELFYINMEQQIRHNNHNIRVNLTRNGILYHKLGYNPNPINKEGFEMIIMLISMGKWAIWITRNMMVYNKEEKEVKNVINLFISKIQQRCKIDPKRMHTSQFDKRWSKGGVIVKRDGEGNLVFLL